MKTPPPVASRANPTAIPNIAPVNSTQVAYWNGATGERWASEQDTLDRSLRVYGNAALQAANVRAGETVLDVGCGAGDTTIALGERVGPEGMVLGLDVSAPMLARARQRTLDRRHISWVLGDASVQPFVAGRFDLLFSRFGVMFFGDPIAAFTHLRTALKPGGRVAFVCWRTLDENPWAHVPLQAALRVVPPPAEPTDPNAPGPFAFGASGRAISILEAAGFVNAVAVKQDTVHRVGVIDPPTIDEAADFAMKLGPAARLLADLDEDLRARGRAAIKDAFAPHFGANGVEFRSATWIVTAEKR